MLTKLKHCDGCNSEQAIWKSEGRLKYCQRCWSEIKTQTPRTVTTKTINPRSEKRIIQDKQYSVLRKEFLQHNPSCIARLEGCTWYDPETLTIQHKKGRNGSLYLDTRYWIVLCFNCHRWVNEHPSKAMELGLADSRLN